MAIITKPIVQHDVVMRLLKAKFPRDDVSPEDMVKAYCKAGNEIDELLIRIAEKGDYPDRVTVPAELLATLGDTVDVLQELILPR
jgi:hypothetical protein